MMRLMTIVGCAVGAVLGSSILSAQGGGAQSGAAQSGGTQGGGARAAIDAVNKQFLEGITKKDPAAIAALYTTDAEAYPPNSPVVRGRPEIQKLWQSVIDSGVASATLTTRQVESSGDLAYESGGFEMKTQDGKVADQGNYVVVWKRATGKWMLHRDIWNSNQPAK